MDNLQRDIMKWSDATFGTTERRGALLAHLSEEVDELFDAFDEADFDKAACEATDCLLFLIQFIGKCGYSAEALALEKLEVNKRRKWSAPNSQGYCKAVKE